MARKLVTIEVSVVSCRLGKTLAGRKKDSAHMAQVSLIWPRAGIALRNSAFKLELISGQCDLRKESWNKTILFKENVESTFGLRVDITEPMKNEALEQILRVMAGAALSLGSDVLEDTVPCGSVAAAPVDYIAKKIKKIPETDVIASGFLDVSAGDIPSQGELVRTVDLQAPLDVIKRSRRTVNRKTKVIRKVLLKKGESNGRLTLSFRRI
ncbi:MAG: hypothetical protein R6V06_06215 [Kiritimatiellia bacterium]